MTSKRLIPSKRFRLVVSSLLVLHLLAIFLPPLSFQSRGPLGQSPSVASLLWPLEGYGQFLYMNRGYAFFAPDPGPSHLMQAAITDPQGNRQEVMYPDLRQQWPRLLYHRHFMLTEYLNFHDYNVQVQLCESYQAHLRQKHQVEEVTITKVEHLLPSEFHILEGGSLEHPELWVEIPLSELREEAAREAAEDVSE